MNVDGSEAATEKTKT